MSHFRYCCVCLLAVFLFWTLSSTASADFLVTNMLAEVGVIAGDSSDGVGGHEITSAFLTVSDGVPGTADFQFAQALFELTVDDQSGMADYLLTYDSQVLVMTGGIGNAGALSNGIIVFSLTEDFSVSSLSGESLLFDSMGEGIVIGQGMSLLLDAGVYSLSFGSSAFISDGGPSQQIANGQSGLLAFDAASVPEPGITSLLLLCLGFLSAHNRRTRC